MVGLQADNQGAVVIGLKLGPVYGYDNLGAFGHHIGNPVIEKAPDIELDVGQQAVDLRVRVVMLAALLFVGRLCGSACGESDSNVSCGNPFSLLLVRFFCHDCNDVALRVGVHKFNTEPLYDRDVRRRTVAM